MTARQERARDAEIHALYKDLAAEVSAGLAAAEAEAELAAAARSRGWTANDVAWATRRGHGPVGRWADRHGIR